MRPDQMPRQPDGELAGLPAVQRWHATGDYAYPAEEREDGEFVAYDDHRAELLRRNREISELRSICAATYQAAGCYGLPERFKDALSNGATGERIHDVDVDHLLPVFPTDWVERAERAEAELAALKARIAASASTILLYAGAHWPDAPDCTMVMARATMALCGKRVRLLVEDDNEH